MRLVQQAQGRRQVAPGLLVNEIARLLSQVLTEFHGMPKRLQGLPAPAAADMQAQLQGLVHKRFLPTTSTASWRTSRAT
jgi:ATP-dependent helicase HrpA